MGRIFTVLDLTSTGADKMVILVPVLHVVVLNLEDGMTSTSQSLLSQFRGIRKLNPFCSGEWIVGSSRYVELDLWLVVELENT